MEEGDYVVNDLWGSPIVTADQGEVPLQLRVCKPVVIFNSKDLCVSSSSCLCPPHSCLRVFSKTMAPHFSVLDNSFKTVEEVEYVSFRIMWINRSRPATKATDKYGVLTKY